MHIVEQSAMLSLRGREDQFDSPDHMLLAVSGDQTRPILLGSLEFLRCLPEMLDLSVFSQKVTQIFELFQALRIHFELGCDVVVLFGSVG